MSVRAPHWDLPIRLEGGRIAMVEQDSPTEIANCVEVAARTPLGTRLEDPEFGVPSVVMQADEVDVDTLRAAVTNSEPRAAVIAERIKNPTDLRAQHVRLLLEEAQS
jgi:hypothetical protein